MRQGKYEKGCYGRYKKDIGKKLYLRDDLPARKHKEKSAYAKKYGECGGREQRKRSQYNFREFPDKNKVGKKRTHQDEYKSTGCYGFSPFSQVYAGISYKTMLACSSQAYLSKEEMEQTYDSS